MSDKEVELNNAAGDDFEVVPIGPIRKLERRMDKLQEEAQKGGGSNQELVRDIMDIMKSNQRIVNEMTESTHELKNSVQDLTHKMDEVVDNMNAFMEMLKEASEVDMEGEVMGDMQSRIADAIGNQMQDVATEITRSNKELIEKLENMDAQQPAAPARPTPQQQSNTAPRPQNNSQNNSSTNLGNIGNKNSSERMEKLKNKFGENDN